MPQIFNEDVQVKGLLSIDGESTGVTVDAQGLKRVGLMKYADRETGIWRLNRQDFEIGRVDAQVTALPGKPTAFTTDLYVAGDGKVTVNGDLSVGGSVKVNNGIEATSSVNGVTGRSTSANDSGVYGVNSAKGGGGVAGRADEGWGVVGMSKSSGGVLGKSEKSNGVTGQSASAQDSGVYGVNSAKGGGGVAGRADEGYGVVGMSKSGIGVSASSEQGIALKASATKDTAVFAHSDTGVGIDARSGSSIGIVAQGGEYAGYFHGIVMVTGDVRLTENAADCAEEFAIANLETIEPGTVMVLGEEDSLSQSTKAYDKKVAGVVSGAGNFRAGLILDRQPDSTNRLPIALMGKVYCKVDAQYAPIEVGDLLTTSPTPGHAMNATDSTKAFGAIIGKALKPLDAGTGLIPILVALQ